MADEAEAPKEPRRKRASKGMGTTLTPSEMGRRGGMKGGAMRAARMTPEERRASAQLAAARRWAKPPRALTQEAPAETSVVVTTPPSPFAKFPGELNLGGQPIECYVLDTGERVISLRTIVRSVAGVESSSLADYVAIEGLKDFLNSELVLADTVEFHIPGTQFKGRGLKAERFIEICNAYLSALAAGTLRTERQRENAIRCSILMVACAKTGLIALIDEATGYQYIREEDALQVKIRAYISDELRAWEKTFPDELWEMFGRLTKWQGSLHSRPKWWGHLVNELIYQALDPDIADYLKKNKPKPFHGQNYHQWLSEDIGLKSLVSHIYKVIGMGDGCQDMRELRDKVATRYGRNLVQLTMSLPAKSDA